MPEEKNLVFGGELGSIVDAGNQRMTLQCREQLLEIDAVAIDGGVDVAGGAWNASCDHRHSPDEHAADCTTNESAPHRRGGLLESRG